MHTGFIDGGWHDLDAHTHRFLTEVTQLVRIAQIKRHDAGEELNRIIRFQPCSLIGHKRISSRVGFVKTVVRELGHQIVDHPGLIFIDLLLNRPLNKAGSLDLHFSRNLLTHRTA